MNQNPRAWPADQVERWPLARVRPDPRNPRTHSAAQIGQIAASMQEFGWTIPLLVDESGALIAGHGRIEAARLLELPDAPVMVARGWSEAQIRAYRIADNKLALNAGWDASILSDELAALGSEGFAIDLLGFSNEDMARLADDTDRLALDHAAQAAMLADPTEWRHTPAVPHADIATGADSASVTHADTGGYVSPTTAGTSPASPNAGAELAVFSCMVTLADRPALFDAIARAKARGAPDSGAALVLIAAEWMQACEPGLNA
ncbi:ParB/Srx family N-terminal domain-containing protein [Paraburkholderia azotifigens]|uniref:ParB/Srx family N-terminal domain-containing protein n=1 Tax=Paraburkholderia azotifigens TaxID=2057004 RepID=UPI003178E11D